MPEYKIPLEPARVVRKSIIRSYNIGGWCLLFHFLGSNILAYLLIAAIKAIISSISGGADSSAIASYMSESSILSGINLIIYMLATVGFAMLGFKWSKNNFRSIVQPKGYNFAYAIQYCIIAMFIWVATTYLSLGIEQIFDKFGYSTIVSDSSDIGVTGIGYAVMTIYSCIIAPITEICCSSYGTVLRTCSLQYPAVLPCVFPRHFPRPHNSQAQLDSSLYNCPHFREHLCHTSFAY